MSLIKKPFGSTKNRKRIGRGRASGTGTTAGKGNNGQRARAGGGVSIGFEGGQMPLFRRLPRRGFSNHKFKTVYEEINLFTLEKYFNSNDIITLDKLKEKLIIPKNSKFVKVLNNGTLTKSLILKNIKITKNAEKSLKEVGGKIEE